jgi:hypothetical protein
MPAKKSKYAKTPRTAAGAKSTRGSRGRANAHAEPAVLARLPKPIREALADARERSHEVALASLGMFSQVRKQSEARMAEMVEEGRRVEPKVKKAVEKWKESLQSRLDVKKFKFPKLNRSFPRFDAAGRHGA